MAQVNGETSSHKAHPGYTYATIETATEPLPEGWEIDLDAGSNGFKIEGGAIVAVHYRRRTTSAI